MEDCKNAIRKYRGGLPAVYNAVRYRETPQSFIDSESHLAEEMERRKNIEAEIKFEVFKRMASLRKSVIMRNEHCPVCDMTKATIDMTISDSFGSNCNLTECYNSGKDTSAQPREEIAIPSSASEFQ